MKNMKTLLATAIAASTVAASAAMAEVSASVGVANMYLWRGFDLGAGNGVPAVSGDINYSTAGFYTGIWASSGDEAAGNEYDLYAGWGGEFGLFTIDISAWNYNYDGAGYVSGDTMDFDHTDLVISMGVGPVAFTVYDNVAGFSGAAYYTLSADVGSFSFLVGMHNKQAEADGDPTVDDKPVHINVSYAFNDNLAFTLSQFVADEDNVDDDLKFVVSYNIPISM